MRPLGIFLLALLLVMIGLAAYGGYLVHEGFSARAQPPAVEALFAGAIRNWSIPSDAKNAKNPFTATPDILKEAREHYADHCAVCHANDGSGKTEMGDGLYPKPPDMRLAHTQNLTDGEIYYIIHDGVRLTGMPGWGLSEKDPDSWKLALFIRHLPQLTQDEIKDMEHYNPTSEVEREEQEQEREFLNGGDVK